MSMNEGATNLFNVWLPQIDYNLCDGCGICVEKCPVGALGIVQGKAVVLRPDICNYCALCEEACPPQIIQLPYLIGVFPPSAEDYE